MLKSQKSSARQARFECLENRNLMAGHVQATFVGDGTLELIGDRKGNRIEIHQISTAITKVQGIDTKLVVNGRIRESATFDAMGLTVELRGGNDSLSIYDTSLSLPAKIDSGSGNDVVYLENFYGGTDIAIDAGTGNDFVWLNWCGSLGVGIDAGDGRDVVAVFNVWAEFGLAVEMGRGNFNTLGVQNCQAPIAVFGNRGTNGIIVQVNNDFTLRPLVHGFRWKNDAGLLNPPQAPPGAPWASST